MNNHKTIPANAFVKLTVDSSVIPKNVLPDIIKGRLDGAGLKCNRVLVNGIGRKKVNTRVKIVYDTLRACPTVTAAAAELGISRGSVYNIVKNPKKLLRGKV